MIENYILVVFVIVVNHVGFIMKNAEITYSSLIGT